LQRALGSDPNELSSSRTSTPKYFSITGELGSGHDDEDQGVVEGSAVLFVPRITREGALSLEARPHLCQQDLLDSYDSCILDTTDTLYLWVRQGE